MATTSHKITEQGSKCCPIAAAKVCCQEPGIVRSLLGGLAGTAAITATMYLVAPKMLGQAR